MDAEHEWTRDELRRMLERLSERERQVMTLRFGLWISRITLSKR